MHEIYHIVHGDHFYQVKKKGMTGIQQNWLGDFITNYNLVKAGYEQLPIGLFSNDYNYDHFDTMNDMQDAIMSDMKDITQEQEQQMSDQMDDHMDENHEETGKSQDGKSQGGKSQGGESQGGESQDGKSQGVSKGIEDAMKKADKNMANSEDKVNDIDKKVEDMKKEQEQDDAVERAKKQERLEQKRKEQEKRTQELSNQGFKNPINWKKLIQKMFPKETEVEEESLARIHKRTRAQLAIANKNAPISIKAGTIKNSKESQSLMFILDKSGSMSSVIDGISMELLKLINKNMTLGVDNMFVMMFDSSYDIYKVNLDKKGKKHTYQALQTPIDLITVPADKLKLAGTPKPIINLFKIQWGAGTIFPKEIVKIVDSLMKQNFNQVIFTDTDILQSQNLQKLKKLMMKGNQRPFSFNIILDSKTSLESARSEIGGNYKYMSNL